MYPTPAQVTIDVGRLGEHLCGPFRPGHFRGVATVVLKLFDIVQPDTAYFGEKDAQQLAIIRRMVRDLNVPVSIVGIATVREPDGLALSSRNRRLSADERQVATALYRALLEAERHILDGQRDVSAIRRRAVAVIPSPPNLRLEYLELVDPDTLEPISVIAGPVLIAGALWVGSTRLIDNVLVVPQPAARP
jgi:pantoate--beta-alanine ligase